MIPILLMFPALFINVSAALLVVIAAVVGLLVFRFLLLVPRLACAICLVRSRCPNAKAMGVS